MRSDSLATVEALNRGLGCPNRDALADQCIGHAVVMAVELDVIVDIDTDVWLGGCDLKSLDGKWFEGRAIDVLEERAPASFQL